MLTSGIHTHMLTQAETSSYIRVPTHTNTYVHILKQNLIVFLESILVQIYNDVSQE